MERERKEGGIENCRGQPTGYTVTCARRQVTNCIRGEQDNGTVSPSSLSLGQGVQFVQTHETSHKSFQVKDPLVPKVQAVLKMR